MIGKLIKPTNWLLYADGKETSLAVLARGRYVNDTMGNSQCYVPKVEGHYVVIEKFLGYAMPVKKAKPLQLKKRFVLCELAKMREDLKNGVCKTVGKSLGYGNDVPRVSDFVYVPTLTGTCEGACVILFTACVVVSALWVLMSLRVLILLACCVKCRCGHGRGLWT